MKDLTNYLRRKTASEEELQAADAIEKLLEELKTAECNYACEIGDTQELREELATTQKLLEESRANDRTAMGYLTEIRGIVGGDDFPDMVARVAAEKKNDERWQWLRENGVYLIECVIERRGYRSTAVDAQWEVWHERNGWVTSAHHNYQEPFRTMDDAVDDAMRKEQQP
jgi:hypothetical protein